MRRVTVRLIPICSDRPELQKGRKRKRKGKTELDAFVARTGTSLRSSCPQRAPSLVYTTTMAVLTLGPKTRAKWKRQQISAGLGMAGYLHMLCQRLITNLLPGLTHRTVQCGRCGWCGSWLLNPTGHKYLTTSICANPSLIALTLQRCLHQGLALSSSRPVDSTWQHYTRYTALQDVHIMLSSRWNMLKMFTPGRLVPSLVAKH